MHLCWSAKGGSGTTVVAASLALVLSHRRPTVLVDLAADAPAALGIAEPSGPGVADWLHSSAADAAAFWRLGVPATESLRVVPRGAQPPPLLGRWAELAEVLGASADEVVVDAGCGVPHPALVEAATHSLLVTRQCYLSLRHAIACGVHPTGIVVLCEPGRVLTVREVERAVGAPVVAEVQYDPLVARAVDAGLLATRLPRSLAHELARHMAKEVA